MDVKYSTLSIGNFFSNLITLISLTLFPKVSSIPATSKYMLQNASHAILQKSLKFFNTNKLKSFSNFSFCLAT